MALKIIENQGVFELHGTLNTTTTKLFKQHFDLILQTTKNLIINIDELNFIDKSGVEVLKQLLYKGQMNHNCFSIVGDGCKDIYEEFKTTLAA
ncbi:STAS domain-containing protein [Psychroserpens sp. S379A]|uniref:STAS domain-containing protein n=1 Tax=Psychroserpens sp. S379A TaxID=3415137 RepID=UPI003C7CDD1C